MNDKAVLFVELPAALKSAVERLASERERTLSAEVRFPVRREIERHSESDDDGG